MAVLGAEIHSYPSLAIQDRAHTVRIVSAHAKNIVRPRRPPHRYEKTGADGGLPETWASAAIYIATGYTHTRPFAKRTTSVSHLSVTGGAICASGGGSAFVDCSFTCAPGRIVCVNTSELYCGDMPWPLNSK